MKMPSLLYAEPPRSEALSHQAPACFPDLHLDQVVVRLTAGRDDADLASWFWTPLVDVAAIQYRHAVLHDLENASVSDVISRFMRRFAQMRQDLDQVSKLYYRRQKARWFLNAVETYCAAIRAFAYDLSVCDLTSQGLQAFREYLTAYAASESFTVLAAEVQRIQEELGTITYTIHIFGNRVTVNTPQGEEDMSDDIAATFARFQQGAVKDRLASFREEPDMNHVEAQILEGVARLNRAVFQALDQLYTTQHHFLDAGIVAFHREVQFYFAYLDYIAPLKAAGLPFCYPAVSAQEHAEEVSAAFDLALAGKRIREQQPIICNDFTLSGAERIFVVTGPNQGGKTTFARLFGQLHYLARLGLPVPARYARLFLCDQIFTHFEREEDLTTLRGKLEDEVERIHAILEQATERSIIIMNESFSATTAHDTRFLGTQILERISNLGCLCVYVTFIDELASLNEHVVSLVSIVDPQNSTKRTYTILRQEANGLAYALAIAEQYGLTAEAIRRRMQR